MKRRHAPPSGFRFFMYLLAFGLIGMALDVAQKVQP